MRDEEKASGIDTDLSDVEKALEEIVEKEAVVEETAQNDKKKVDSAKAAEMRYRALENLGGTQKRQRKDELENETAARAKHRRSGSDIFARKERSHVEMENGRNAATEAAIRG